MSLAARGRRTRREIVVALLVGVAPLEGVKPREEPPFHDRPPAQEEWLHEVGPKSREVRLLRQPLPSDSLRATQWLVVSEPRWSAEGILGRTEDAPFGLEVPWCSITRLECRRGFVGPGKGIGVGLGVAAAGILATSFALAGEAGYPQYFIYYAAFLTAYGAWVALPIGAGIGGAITAFSPRWVPVYRAEPPPPGAPPVTPGPGAR